MKMRPSTKSMRIPAPTYEGDSVTFVPIVKSGYWEPFGYREDPEDAQILLPVQEELLLLEQAKAYLKQKYSLRDVSRWLSTQSGRNLSHQGLKDRVASDKTKDKDYTNSKHLALQFMCAYKKARKLEDSRLGQTEPLESTLNEEIMSLASETS